ncbi:hypothetical protein [Flectobacillus major]|jgi:ElaB/YqjD/DUF883 family membrane-anchored ribosome-binding protein|uniref:hypothetical protein n=1 Tax=Flectobacillus major TaxID=103 RepID=UPI00040CBF2B|nr:hypothetical protein [Flectobacillus major]
MKTIALFSFFVLISWGGFSQDKLKSLTTERQLLYNEYLASESQSSGLFGNRTKDDMQTSIEALKQIMEKDNQILDELKNLQEQSKADFTEKYNDLIQQNNDLTQKNRELIELTERHKGWSKENHTILENVEQEHTLAISIAAVLGFLFLLYLIKYFGLKSQYKELQRKIKGEI